MNNTQFRVIISGGGTGGHIFPAIAIANAIKVLVPKSDILFIGALGRMEMQRVPDAGYKIKGLPICGFNRKNPLKNITVLFKIWKSQQMAKAIIKEFQPNVVVGVGGYASGPTLNQAASMGIPCVIQEQNSYAGVTNKLLANKVAKICVAYKNMERFFPKEKILLTGNPVRQDLFDTNISQEEAKKSFGLDGTKKTILFIGGSLGAKTINDSILNHIDFIQSSDVQIIWQTGKYYSTSIQKQLEGKLIPNLCVTDFIKDMGVAFRAADLVVSRAGASSISEFCLLGKPVILVPSPNVAEDHQTKNAMALVTQHAAMYVKDNEAPITLLDLAIETVNDNIELFSLSENIKKLALPNSARIIAEEIIKVAGYKDKDSSNITKKVDLGNIKSVYFIGAGGIGMSAIERYFLKKGVFVAGYDRVESELTKTLEEEGVKLHYDEDISLIPEECKEKSSTLVIYTPAIPAEHKELVYFQQNAFEIQKRAQVLGTITHNSRGLCVAGTHGKTTTSTMLAHIMHQSHLDCNALLGGISKNYGTNYILSNSDYVVIEADEFDRSFHWLRPYMSVITSTDADHLDIYGTEETYLESFRHYSSLIQPNGVLLLHTGLKMQQSVDNSVKVYTYDRDEGDFHAENIRIKDGTIKFDFVSPLHKITDIQLGQPIPINIENGIAAMAIAQLNGCTDDEIRYAMATFEGVVRRFDFKIKTDNIVFLSDYAHHPKEIMQCAKSLKEVYSGKKITAIFQPHLYTRTRDFYQDFADSLSLFDEVILLDIYPARELPIEGVTSALIYENLHKGVSKFQCTKENIQDFVRAHEFEVLIVLGAGDLDNQVPEIKQILLDKQ